MDLENATLIHHWKFNDDVHDGISILSFKYTLSSFDNVPTSFTHNKDNVITSALDNSTGKPLWTDEREGIKGKFAVSMWVRYDETRNPILYPLLSFTNDYNIRVSSKRTAFITFMDTYLPMITQFPENIKNGDWFHLLHQLDTDTGGFKLYINGILMKSGTPHFLEELELPAGRFCINGTYAPEGYKDIGSKLNLDEIKVFTGWLTDGGVVTGGFAGGEVFALYSSGVNNIPKPFNVVAVGLSKTTAAVTWE